MKQFQTSLIPKKSWITYFFTSNVRPVNNVVQKCRMKQYQLSDVKYSNMALPMKAVCYRKRKGKETRTDQMSTKPMLKNMPFVN